MVPRPGTQRTWEKKHTKGKKWILLIELQLPGAEGRRSLRRPSGQQRGCRQGSSRLHLELAGAGAVEQRQKKGKVGAQWGLGEGRGVGIQAGGRLLSSALLVLIKTELREVFMSSLSEAAKSIFREGV